VNGVSIPRRAFDMAVQIQFRQRGPGDRRHEDLKAVRDTALDALIDNELLYQKAVQAKTTVTDAEVKTELQSLEKSLGTTEEVAAFLKQNGLAEKDLRDEVRRSLIVRRFTDATLPAPAAPGEAAERAYYDAHPEMFARPEAVRIAQIVVRTAPAASPAERDAARQKIEDILKELKAGKDFGEMARAHSEGTEAQHNGDSGWVWAGGEALPPVERAALALQAGQTSDVVESRRGFHLIKALERRPAGVVPFDEAKERIGARLASESRDQRVRGYVATLRKNAKIERTL
jgi:peptidyl-prolyl cis-trans isomerase C